GRSPALVAGGGGKVTGDGEVLG
ncbi:hypothetical protein TIFTF001_051038, partial [Ficus carica]